MRYGFTTGSCAAAAAKAATYMLLTGKEKKEIEIDTPKGIVYKADIEHIVIKEQQVFCAVRKDGGDDPDVTTGSFIVANVMLETYEGERAAIHIDGGLGVGRVTKPGMDQPVGNAAINRVPRAMIEKEVLEICRLVDFTGTLHVVISVPKGEELAKRTFNPRLGIVGGISILGTTGIVEPMSVQALLDTIKVELNMKKAVGYEAVVVSPGNYGLDFMQRTYGFHLDQSVKCSNYIGDAIDMAIAMEFQSILLTGHIGKLIKLAGGMMNTHSKEGDCRMELLTAAALQAGADGETGRAILDCVVSEAGIRIIRDAGLLEATMHFVMEKVQYHLDKRSQGKIRIECIVYANEFGELGKSQGAVALLEEIKMGAIDT